MTTHVRVGLVYVTSTVRSFAEGPMPKKDILSFFFLRYDGIFALLTTRVVVALGRFWSAEKRALKSEEKERKRVSKTIMMMIMIMIITTTTRDGMNNNTYIYKYSLGNKSFLKCHDVIIARLFSSSSSSVCLRLYPFYASRFSEWPSTARVPSPVRDGFCAPPRLLLRLRF